MEVNVSEEKLIARIREMSPEEKEMLIKKIGQEEQNRDPSHFFPFPQETGIFQEQKKDNQTQNKWEQSDTDHWVVIDPGNPE